MTLSTTDALGLLASGVFLVRLLPQPVRLARTGVASGVSPLAALNSMLTMVAWVAYGLIVGPAARVGRLGRRAGPRRLDRAAAPA